jgi:hypothetical protein
MPPKAPQGGPAEGQDITQASYNYLVTALLRSFPQLKPTKPGSIRVKAGERTLVFFNWDKESLETGTPRDVRFEILKDGNVSTPHFHQGGEGLVMFSKSQPVAKEEMDEKALTTLNDVLGDMYEYGSIDPAKPLDEISGELQDAMGDTRMRLIDGWMTAVRGEHAGLFIGRWLAGKISGDIEFIRNGHDPESGVIELKFPAGMVGRHFPQKVDSIRADYIREWIVGIPRLGEKLGLKRFNEMTVTCSQESPESAIVVRLKIPRGEKLEYMSIPEVRAMLKENMLEGATVMAGGDMHLEWPEDSAEAQEGVHFHRFEKPGTKVYARTYVGKRDNNEDGWATSFEDDKRME